MAEEGKKHDTPQDAQSSRLAFAAGKDLHSARRQRVAGAGNRAQDVLKQAQQRRQDNAAKQAQENTRVTELEAELAKAKLDAAVQVALLKAGALDTDYLAYKLQGMDGVV